MDKKILLKLDLELYEEIVKLASLNNRDITKQIRSLLMSGMNNYYTNKKLEELFVMLKDIKDFQINTVGISKFTKDLLIQIYSDLSFTYTIAPKDSVCYQRFLQNRKKDRFND